MRWYTVSYGVMGWIPDEDRYILFATDTEYIEYYNSE